MPQVPILLSLCVVIDVSCRNSVLECALLGAQSARPDRLSTASRSSPRSVQQAWLIDEIVSTAASRATIHGGKGRHRRPPLPYDSAQPQ